MNNDPTVELWFLTIRSLIADKEMEIAIANKETASGGWLSDHCAAIAAINSDIEHYMNAVRKYT